MHTFKRNPWIACLVLLAAATGGVTAAGTAPQAQQTQSNAQSLQEERRKALEKIMQDLQKTAAPQQQVPAQNPLGPSPAPAITQRAPLAGGDMTLEFDNQELYGFITQIADMLQITPIVIDPDVKGVVTIHTSAPMTKQDVFVLFNIILKNNNAALVKSRGIYQIIPISQGLREGLEVVVNLPPAPPEKVPPEKPAQDKDATKKTDPPAGDVIKKTATPPAAAGGTTPPGAATVQNPPGAAAAQTPPGAAAAQTLPGAAAAQTPPATGAAAPARAGQTPQQPPSGQARPATAEAPRLVTNVIRVEFVPVQTLIEPLKLFMTEGGVIMPYERLNMLIITDYTDSAQKLLEVIHLLDNSYLDTDLIDLVEIKYNAAADVLADLQKVFGSGKDSTTGVYMVSLDRINTIMVMANSKRALDEVKRWIGRLDSTTGRSVQTFMYPVQNATASNIAMVLSLLFGGGDSGTTGVTQPAGTSPGGAYSAPGATGSRGAGGGGFTPTSAGGSRSLSTGIGGQSPYSGGSMFSGQQGYGGGSPYGLGAGMGMLGGGNVGGPRLNQGGGMSAQWLNGGQFVGLQGMVRLVADDINNALIIQASSADYDYLKDTITRMDVLPRQAIIDARIFEIDLTDDLSFGVSATLQGRTADNHLTTAAISSTTGALSAASFAFVGNSREILMNLDALRQKTKVRILEAPSVLALDGTPARINVGGSVPVPTQSYVTTGGAATGVSYRDTGTSLLITPRISASGTVTLYVYQEVSSQGAQTPNGPSFNQTNVETTLAVRDGESVAIAGLIRENDSNARNGVPFLSEIPLLGALFGRTTRSSTRSELLIMITPHVIRTPERFREMTEEIKDSLRNVRKFADDKQKEIIEDQEKARKERIESLEKKSEPPAVIKKQEDPLPPPVKK